MRFTVIFFGVIALLGACKQEVHKTTPDELIAAIEKTGVKVEKDGAYNNERTKK